MSFSATPNLWTMRFTSHLPVPPKGHKNVHHKFKSLNSVMYSRMFWKRVSAVNDFTHNPFWVSDFKHRYLIATGRDYLGAVPVMPAPGMYPLLRHNKNIRRTMGGHHTAMQETRHLPIMPLTPRVVYEHRYEKINEFKKKVKEDRRIIFGMREHEFHDWYMKLQRVRGKWCRQNEVSSRGIYGPAVDAAEMWG